MIFKGYRASIAEIPLLLGWGYRTSTSHARSITQYGATKDMISAYWRRISVTKLHSTLTTYSPLINSVELHPLNPGGWTLQDHLFYNAFSVPTPNISWVTANAAAKRIV